MKLKTLLTALFLILGAGAAHACNVPNPNLLAFSSGNLSVDGCPLPAAALNRLAPLSNPAFSGLLNGVSAFMNLANVANITTDTYALTATDRTDGSFPLGGYSAQQIYEWAIGTGSVAAPSADMVRGVAVHTAGSTVLDVNGTAGYVVNLNAASGSAQVSSGLKGIAVCAANSAHCWGIDTIVTDSKGTSDATAYTSESLFNEFDYNVNKTGTTIGFLIGGTWGAQPTSATGPTVLKPNGTGSWQYAFGTADGCCTTAYRIGASATSGASKNSQNVDMKFFDAGSVSQTTTLAATPGGVLISSTSGPAASISLSGTASVVNAPSNGGLQVNSLTLASADSGANAFLCSAAGTAVCNIGQTASVVSVAGAFLPKSTTVGSLPTCAAGTRGDVYQVSDQSGAPSYRGALTGGGSIQVLALCNGSSWEAH